MVQECEYPLDRVGTTADMAKDRTADMGRDVTRTVQGLAGDMETEMEAMGTQVMETARTDTATMTQVITINMGPTDITDRLIRLFIARSDSGFTARSQTVGNELCSDKNASRGC